MIHNIQTFSLISCRSMSMTPESQASHQNVVVMRLLSGESGYAQEIDLPQGVFEVVDLVITSKLGPPITHKICAGGPVDAGPDPDQQQGPGHEPFAIAVLCLPSLPRLPLHPLLCVLLEL